MFLLIIDKIIIYLSGVMVVGGGRGIILIRFTATSSLIESFLNLLMFSKTWTFYVSLFATFASIFKVAYLIQFSVRERSLYVYLYILKNYTCCRIYHQHHGVDIFVDLFGNWEQQFQDLPLGFLHIDDLQGLIFLF